MENATIITLGNYPAETSRAGYAKIATFEEAFGEYSLAKGKGRARRMARKKSRRSDRATKRTDRRTARNANKAERVGMRDERKRGKVETRQLRRNDRKQGRQDMRLDRRANRKEKRQTMRGSNQEARQGRRDIRKTRRMDRKEIGAEYEEEYNDQEAGNDYGDDESPVGYDQGYDDQGYDDQGYDDQGYDDQGYDEQDYDDNVGNSNPYTSGGGGSPYADMGYEEEYFPEYDMGYEEEYLPEYDMGYEQEDNDDYYDEEWQPEFDFDGEPDDNSNFSSESKESSNAVSPKVQDTVQKIEWNKELIQRLRAKRGNFKAAGQPTKGVESAIMNRVARLADLESSIADYSNASGGVSNKRREIEMARRNSRKARFTKRGFGTRVKSKLNPKFSNQRIEIPASSNMDALGTGQDTDGEFLYSESWSDDSPLASVFEVQSNASGNFKAAAKKINWVAIGIGAAIAVTAIIVIRKYKLIK